MRSVIMMLTMSLCLLVAAAFSIADAAPSRPSLDRLRAAGAGPFQECAAPRQTCEQLTDFAQGGTCPACVAVGGGCCRCANTNVCAQCDCELAWDVWCSIGATHNCACGERFAGVCMMFPNGMQCGNMNPTGTQCAGAFSTCCHP